jgi:O-antigen ligase
VLAKPGSSSSGALNGVFVGFAALVLGFATFSSGGVITPEWDVCLVAVCVLSLAVLLPARPYTPAPPQDRVLGTILIALPSYVALQLLPLPLAWLRLISPARAALETATFPIGLGNSRAPLSVSPALTMAHLLRLLCFICVFFLIRELTRRFAEWPAMMALPLVVIGSAEAALGLAQYFGGAAKATGTYVNSNHYSCFLQMVLPFPLVLTAIALRRGTRRTGSLKRTVLACALSGCAALIFLGALYSMSRMGLAAIGASLLVLVFLIPMARFSLRKSPARAIYISAAVAAVAIILLLFVSTPGALLERIANRGGQEPLTVDARVQIWRETLPMAADYRIFGSGLGTYASVFQKYRASAPEYLVDFAHNDYLQLLAELGVIGFAIAVASALTILVQIVRAMRGGPTTAHRLVAAACAAALVALMLDCSVDFDFYIPANAMLASWVAGVGTAIGISRSEDSAPTKG